MRGSKPGERRGGRKKGTPNKKNAVKIAAIEQSGITPLDFMLNVMREPIPEDAPIAAKNALRALRLDAAKSAAPYVHPRLASTELSTKDGKPLVLQLVNYADPNSVPLPAAAVPTAVLPGNGPRGKEGGAVLEPQIGEGEKLP